MAIEQFGRITYNDINNLQNNSITTGNLTCTGNITCNTSGAGIVTANQYKGTKYTCTVLYNQNGMEGSTSESIGLFELIVLEVKWYDTSWTSAIYPSAITNYIAFEPLIGKRNTESGICVSKGSYEYSLYFSTSDYKKMNVSKYTGVTWVYILGLK